MGTSVVDGSTGVESDGGDRGMKFVTYNIQYGLGGDDRYDLDRTAAVVEGVDVIALQEVERFWKRSGMTDQVAELTDRLPDYHWVFGPGLDIDASYRDESGHLVNRRRQHGTMLMSRPPIVSSRNFPLPKYGTLKQHSIQQSFLEGVIKTPAGPIRVYSVHLSHLSKDTRAPQIETILNVHTRANGERGAWSGGHPDPAGGWTEGGEPPMPREVALMGDMNITPDSPEYDRIVGPKSPDHGRLNRRDGFVDAWVAAGHAEQDGVTSPAKPHSIEPGADTDSRLDYCFVTAALADRVRSVHIDDQADASDHKPVWVDLDLDDAARPLAA